ncbi:MAG: tetratricopeptide repeat protein [Opitutaceae bacterium]|nr:tetratricopeptide repeat protein [Opitutaceae bacterium]
MKTIAQQFRLRALALALSFLAPAAGLFAQATPPAENPPAKPAAPDEISQAELLKSYLKVREELHATQLAIVNNRVAGVTEKLDSIRVAMEAERERTQLEAQRQAAERERQQTESLRSNRTVLWVAAAFGGLGLIAVLLMPVLQWRTMSRMAEVASLRAAQLPPARSAAPALMGGADLTAPAEQAVSVSNQRLMAVIDRMERRIFELEHTTAPATAAAPVNTTNGTHANGSQTNLTLPSGPEAPRRPAPNADQATWIAVLLNKGRSLVSTNKALDALTCYDEILRLDPKHTEAMIRRGATLERLNRFEEAIQCYERAIEADPKVTLAYLSKGGVCNRLGRYDEALKCYELALQAEEKAK